MSLFSGFEVLAVLGVIGILLLLSVRLRVQKSTGMFLVIIAVMFLALISVSRFAMGLFGTVLLLAVLVVVLLTVILRRR